MEFIDPVTPNDIDPTQAIYDLVNEEFPILIKRTKGKIIKIRVDETWKEVLENTPIEENDKIVRYNTTYTNRSLTTEQLEKIKDYISTNFPDLQDSNL